MDIELLFYISCLNGDLEFAKWLYSIDNNEYDLSPFYVSCYNGYLEFAKWLYSIDNNFIYETDKDGNTPLFYSCFTGKLEIVQWLYSINNNLIYKTNNFGNTSFHLPKHNNKPINTLIQYKLLCHKS